MKPVTKNLVLSLALGLVTMGCAIYARDAVIYHALDYPSPQKEKNSEAPIPETLMIYRFLLSPSVDMDRMSISETRKGEEIKATVRWDGNPADKVTDLLVRDFEKSGLFERTVDQWSNSRYRYALEGAVTKLDGLISEGKASALLEANATLLDFEAPLGSKREIFKKLYRIEIPSPDSNPSSIVKAMDQGVMKLSEQLRADLKARLARNIQVD
jgi:ABC-type uncharacterized transport system auxiliary subunit